jgi:hypothetical protein
MGSSAPTSFFTARAVAAEVQEVNGGAAELSGSALPVVLHAPVTSRSCSLGCRPRMWYNKMRFGAALFG